MQAAHGVASPDRGLARAAGFGQAGGMDPVLALRALSEIVADEAMRSRFLELTGYDVQTLRERAGEPDVARAVRLFLRGHEPDLLRVADALDVKPEELAR